MAKCLPDPRQPKLVKLKMGGKETERVQMKETESLLQLSSTFSTSFPPIEDGVEEDRVYPVAEREPCKAKEQQETKDSRPLLPKMKDGFRITAAWAAEKKQHTWKDKNPKKKSEGRKSTEPLKGKESIENNYKLNQDIADGILQIFTRSIGHRVTIEKMWSELKADEHKKLKPVILHSHKLTSLASPSAKQCLEIYSKPTTTDRYTGKPVPLGQVLNAARRKHSRSTMSIVNSALNENIRQAQAKAEIMTRRRDPYNNSMAREVHQDWFFKGVVEDPSTSLAIPPDIKLPSRQSSRQPSTGAKQSFAGSELKQSASELERSEETISALKRRLPYYLTSSGSVLSASVEVNDKLVCCVPGERSRSMQERQKSSANDSPRQWHKAINEADTSSSKALEPCWQPLTTAALLEHTKVNAIPIRGMGSRAHGHYSMWRPNKIIHH